MKVFLSVPMRGLTDEEIVDELDIVGQVAKAYFPHEDVELVCNWMPGKEQSFEGVKNKAVFYLGEALQSLSTCDAILSPSAVFMVDNDGNCTTYHGCEIEYEVAHAYHIPVYEYDSKILVAFDNKKEEKYV